MGALQALLVTHPETNIHLYIDNHAVVQRWETEWGDNPRGRSTGKARAVWNRIEGLKRAREAAGGSTTGNGRVSVRLRSNLSQFISIYIILHHIYVIVYDF